MQEDENFVHEKRGFGQGSREETLGRSVACMDNLNLTETLTLTKWTDVRAASENTSFFGHFTWNAVKTPPGESTYI
jgi:hypothetical protein